MGNSVTRWFRKLAADDESVQADELSSDVDTKGCQRVAGCGQGQRVTVLGRLRSVDLVPTEALATLVAELWDGTDAILLIWLGQRSIAGIQSGRTIKASGRLALREGRKVLYNPVYELLPVHA